jgi:hypothetical protein
MRKSHLQYSRETRKNNEEITLDILEKILQDPDFFHDLMHSGGFGRSMPNRQLLRRNPGWCRVLQHAVVLGRVTGDNFKAAMDRSLSINRLRVSPTKRPNAQVLQQQRSFNGLSRGHSVRRTQVPTRLSNSILLWKPFRSREGEQYGILKVFEKSDPRVTRFDYHYHSGSDVLVL